ncbi:MAG: Hsp20/alpha crystallin family protein [Alphaproteobacteria bacterium]|nr:Hsp20/alpha crystallin family protein [Alphaproteobacteria bacterium]
MQTGITKNQSRPMRNEDMQGQTMPSSQRGMSLMPGFSYFMPISNFFSDMDQVFDQTVRQLSWPLFPVSTALQNITSMFRPNLDIASNDNEYMITVEVPGMDQKDIRLDVAGGVLTISGEKKQESMDARRSMQCSECSYGAFERTLTLPDDVDESAIEARFKNGVLTIICPRMETQKTQPRQILISSGRNLEGPRSTSERDNQGPRKAA